MWGGVGGGGEHPRPKCKRNKRKGKMRQIEKLQQEMERSDTFDPLDNIQPLCIQSLPRQIFSLKENILFFSVPMCNLALCCLSKAA